MFKQLNEANEPRLQLEVAGGGPGLRRRTAIAAGDDASYIDPSVLPNAPWWFGILRSWQKLDYSGVFCTLPLEVALSLLEKAKIPPLYRVGLGLKWGFIDSGRDNFTLGDLAEILTAAGILEGALDPELARIEQRSTYQIWRKLRHELHSAVDQYWTTNPGLHS